MTAHEAWDELLAGQALHALDPADERRLEQHVVDCETCRAHLAEFEAVAADLGRALPPVPPPSDGKERLRAALATSAGPPPASTPVAPQRAPGSGGPPQRTDRRRPGSGRARRVSRGLLAAMTAAVVLAAGAIGYGVYQRHLASDRGSKLAAAEQVLRGIAGSRRTVVLQSAGTSEAAARGQVVESDGHVWLVADGLAPNDRSSSTYVLWASTPQGEMAAVATFDVGKDGFAIVNKVALPSTAAGTPAFAVSHERGRTAPPRPSTPLLQSSA
jgi:anti-sigma factor RsiW